MMNKEYELKYFIGEEEVKTDEAMLMLVNKLVSVTEETRSGRVVSVHMKPQLH